jgi:hypothetical protein
LIEQIVINYSLKMQTFISLLRCPGGENEGGGTDQKNEEVKSGNEQSGAADKPKEKGFIDKVKDALRDWSNDDKMDQQIDDATP